MKFYFRETYEEIITTFPSNGRFWKAYIEHEMRMGNYEKTEKLFQRCLIKVTHHIIFISDKASYIKNNLLIFHSFT